jgi:pyruvate ferredoxin oxidoreductase gamma subunit
MLELIVQGRGGQGAQTAGTLLAKAFFADGKEVQAFATYGGARRGTPVSSNIRVDDKPVRRRCDIDKPDAILCFDPSLLDKNLLKGATPETQIVVNSSKGPEAFAVLGDYTIHTIDAFEIAKNNDLGRFINSTLLGGFASILNAPDIDVLCKTIAESTKAKQEENARACRDGYNLIQNLRSAA